MGVTGKRVEKLGIGGRDRTMAGAGPACLLPFVFSCRSNPKSSSEPCFLAPFYPFCFFNLPVVVVPGG